MCAHSTTWLTLWPVLNVRNDAHLEAGNSPLLAPISGMMLRAVVINNRPSPSSLELRRVGVGPHERAQRWGPMTRRWCARDDSGGYSRRSPGSSGAEVEVWLVRNAGVRLCVGLHGWTWTDTGGWVRADDRQAACCGW